MTLRGGELCVMVTAERMGYAVIAVITLLALGLIGRLISRRLQPASFPASDLLRRDLAPSGRPDSRTDQSAAEFADLPIADLTSGDHESGNHESAGKYGTTVKLHAQPQPQALIAAPGAPNTDVSTDCQVTARGTATITRRTGRRRSTTSGSD